eukprot:TRINITY_DN1110_c0_g1_i2.p1 TRINITY_DN1110_c0_g1~~TRINITY_DN1110_c0_g1_i2.p1  ORF type:complete len:204 (-),score=22.43 TRINITY_DN1110_c0_g1_i2:111-722(-)
MAQQTGPVYKQMAVADDLENSDADAEPTLLVSDDYKQLRPIVWMSRVMVCAVIPAIMVALLTRGHHRRCSSEPSNDSLACRLNPISLWGYTSTTMVCPDKHILCGGHCLPDGMPDAHCTAMGLRSQAPSRPLLLSLLLFEREKRRYPVWQGRSLLPWPLHAERHRLLGRLLARHDSLRRDLHGWSCRQPVLPWQVGQRHRLWA